MIIPNNKKREAIAIGIDLGTTYLCVGGNRTYLLIAVFFIILINSVHQQLITELKLNNCQMSN